MRLSAFAFVLVAACSSTKATPGPTGPTNASVADTAAAAAGGGTCPAATGAGTAHTADITAAETWTAAGSPHRVTSSIHVLATLTLEPCARVELSKGVTLSVGSSTETGKIVGHGEYVEATATTEEVVRPVVFTSAVAGEHWGSLFLTDKGELDFRVVALNEGGDIDAAYFDYGATIVARGPNDGSLLRSVGAELLVILNSGGVGIALENGAGIKESADAALVILGSGAQPTPANWVGEFKPSYPVLVQPPGVGTLPVGLYHANSDGSASEYDAIIVESSDAVTTDEAFHDRGVPYLMHGSFYMRPATSATLTIDPGLTLKFHVASNRQHPWAMFLGDDSGDRKVKVLMQGTAEKPIIFTSDATTPQAGDWVGLILDNSPTTGNSITHAAFRYAGGESATNGFGCGPGDNDAAILIMNWRPEDAFIQDVEISDSAGGGIVSGWVSNAAGPALKAGNTFSNIANGCSVSKWRLDATNYCPNRPDDECL